jgi:agmatine/peptidylarginine deiminase
VAEFDPMAGVLIDFPLDIPYELVAAFSEDDIVYTLARDQAEENQAAAAFALHGVNMANVHFIRAVTDAPYTRDYGPWYIFDGNGDVAIVNHTYEVDNPNDDMIPRAIGWHFGIPLYDLGLIHVGGNYQSDGHGTAITTRMVYDYNIGFTEPEVDSIMEDFLGIDRNIGLPYFGASTSHHVDCWAKLLSPEKIVIKRVPPTDENYEFVERNVDIIASLETPFGRPYQIFRVDEVGEENYTNSLIINGKIYVPLSESANDAPALAMFEEALPGYEIIGSGNWNWSWGNALHCRTKEMADLGMLYVDHVPLLDTESTTGGYRVDVLIRDHSDTGLVLDSLSLFWRREPDPIYHELSLMPATGQDSFYAEIPAQPLGSTIDYYLRAADYSGRIEFHPMVGEGGPHRFRIKIDEEPPTIDHEPIPDTTELAWPLTTTAVIKDNAAVPEAEVQWFLNGEPQASLPMLKREGWFIYEGTLAGEAWEGDVIDYRIAAMDGTNISYDPAVGYHSFTIIPALPLVIWNPDPTPSSGEAMHQLLTDLSVPHDYLTDFDMPLLVNYASAFIFLGVFDLNRVLTSDESEILSAYLEAGGDVYMEGGDCWNYDPYSEVYMNLFGLDGSGDGTDDLHLVVGIPGTLGEGMSFPYSGENAFMDELMPALGAEAFMRNPADDQFHAVSNQEGPRRTIAASFEFGGLDDGDEPSTKRELLLRYAQFFELPPAYTTLSVARGPGPTEVTLNWHGGQPAYAVYRSHNSSEVVNPGNLLGRTDGLSWTDDPPQDGLHCYIVRGSWAR